MGTQAARRAFWVPLRALLGFATIGVCLLAASAAALIQAPAAQADLQVCTPTSTPTKCSEPTGLATDFETGALYVADTANDRIDIFKNGGTEAGTPASFGGVSGPQRIAVDNVASSPSHHDIYATTADFKVKKFEPNGTKVAEFGEQGDGTPENCQIERANDPIAVGPNGDVFLADSYETGARNNFTSRIIKFSATGVCIGVVPLEEIEALNQTITSLAVDSTGVIYVVVKSFSVGSLIRQYTGTGALTKEFEETYENRNGSIALLNTGAVAVNAEDHLFTAQAGGRKTKLASDHFFTEYDSAAAGGSILRRFAYAPEDLGFDTPGLAALHTADGDLFDSNTGAGVTYQPGVRYLKLPPPGPVIFPEACQVEENGNTKATLVAEVNPEGKDTTVHAEYITEADYQANGNSFSGAHPASKTAESESIGSDFSMQEGLVEAEVAPETKYRCRIVATNADGSATGEEGSFTSLKAIEIGAAFVSDVGAEEATLNAQVDPLGIATTGYFEYVEEATYLKDIEELGPEHGFDHALKAPDPATEEEIEFGGGKGFSTGSQVVKGLKLSTSYRFRIHATNLFFELEGKDGVLGPVAAFRTYGASSEPLPDNRGWELVSPGLKNSADVGGPIQSRGLVDASSIHIQAGASSGEAITYTSWISFGNGDGGPPTSQYLSDRTPSGWQTENISPFGAQSEFFRPPYMGFDSDLRFGVFKVGETSLAPGCPVERENFYLREADGTVRCLTPEEPNAQQKINYCFTYGGASEDGTRVFFSAKVPYAGATESAEGAGEVHRWSLYEFHEGQIHVVNILPGQSEPADPGEYTTFGMRSPEFCQTGQTVLRHAISPDGARVVWTYWPDLNKQKPSQLMMRINGTETIQLDKHRSGSDSKSGDGIFWAASRDDSIVYFTDPHRLLTGSKAEAGSSSGDPGKPDLYRYEVEGEELTDLSKPKANEPADVRGVLGASDDGSVVYFLAKGALTPPSEENQAGEHAEAGKNNLYVYDANQEEGKTTFIAQLSGEDNLDWTSQPQSITSRVTPDGKHLAFLSVESQKLAGYDNTLAAKSGRFSSGKHCSFSEELGGNPRIEGGPNCQEAFVYDAEADSLTCASCNPTNARPIGPAFLPGWTSMSEGPRYLSDDGTKLFFESFDTLSGADENDKRDIYEFELAGSGSCSEESPAYDPASGGCHFLITDGKGEDEAHLIDASADGRDVFFSTRSVLSGWDVNENFDIYDAREGGGFPEPSPVEPCLGEACKPAASTPPSSGSPTTPNFRGAGNPAPEKAKKPKHKKKRHKAKAKKAHGKAKRNGRAGR